MNDETSGITAGQLRSYIERVERLENEKAEIAANVRRRLRARTLPCAECLTTSFATTPPQ